MLECMYCYEKQNTEHKLTKIGVSTLSYFIIQMSAEEVMLKTVKKTSLSKTQVQILLFFTCCHDNES